MRRHGAFNTLLEMHSPRTALATVRSELVFQYSIRDARRRQRDLLRAAVCDVFQYSIRDALTSLKYQSAHACGFQYSIRDAEAAHEIDQRGLGNQEPFQYSIRDARLRRVYGEDVFVLDKLSILY